MSNLKNWEDVYGRILESKKKQLMSGYNPNNKIWDVEVMKKEREKLLKELSNKYTLTRR